MNTHSKDLENNGIDSRLFIKVLQGLDLHGHVAQTAYFYRHQLEKFPHLNTHIMHSACIVLACKQTNINRKQRDVLNVYYWYLKNEKLEINQHLFNLKDSLINAEYLLLRILEFNTDIPSLWVFQTKLLLNVETFYSVEVFQKISSCCFALLNTVIYMDSAIELMRTRGDVVSLSILFVSLQICLNDVGNAHDFDQDGVLDLVRDIEHELMSQYQKLDLAVKI